MDNHLIVVYVSGKITETDPEKQKRNIKTAKRINRVLWEMGYTTICPHTNAPADAMIEYNDYIERDLVLLSRCDCILMLHNWKDSKGAKIEHNFAGAKNIPIFYSIKQLNDCYGRLA